MIDLEWIRNELKIASGYIYIHDPDKDDKNKKYEAILNMFENVKENVIPQNIRYCGSKLVEDTISKLIDGIPLTPVENNDDDWLIRDIDKTREIYKHKRLNTLYKLVEDGKITYIGGKNYLVVCDEEYVYDSSCTIVSEILDKLYPVTFPFTPNKGVYIAHIEKCLSNRNNDKDKEGFDTIYVKNIIEPSGKIINIDLYYSRTVDNWSEIDDSVYESRLELATQRIKYETDLYFECNYEGLKN